MSDADAHPTRSVGWRPAWFRRKKHVDELKQWRQDVARQALEAAVAVGRDSDDVPPAQPDAGPSALPSDVADVIARATTLSATAGVFPILVATHLAHDSEQPWSLDPILSRIAAKNPQTAIWHPRRLPLFGFEHEQLVPRGFNRPIAEEVSSVSPALEQYDLTTEDENFLRKNFLRIMTGAYRSDEDDQRLQSIMVKLSADEPSQVLSIFVGSLSDEEQATGSESEKPPASGK